MWSFGCIMIELFTGFPLFPGTNEREQMQLIIDVIGMPNASVLSRSTRKKLFSQFKNDNTAVPAPLEVITDHEKEKRLKYIMEKLREEPDTEFVNLISRCLEWDPLKRMTPDEGLNHNWILKGLPPGVLDSHKEHLSKSAQVYQQRHTTVQDASARAQKV
jgi:serine/threonine protein kinase